MSNNITRWEKENPPNLLLAIDPGAAWPGAQRGTKIPYAGVALLQWGELAWAGVVRAPTTVAPFARPNALVKRVSESARFARTPAHLGEPLNVLVIENPRLYKRGKARPEDIMDLKFIAGAFMGGIDAEFYSAPGPSEWKGTIDGTILNERVLRVLNSVERTMLVKSERAGDGGLSSHVIDAVGLGLWTVGRMGKAGVL